MSTLLPSTNQSELPVDRVVLLHSICSGRSIDVGTIIRQSIIYIARQATTGGLGHAALITGLCRAAGVQYSHLEPTIQPSHFAHSNIARMTQWAGGIPRPTGLGFEVREGAAPPPPPERPRQRFHGLDGRKDNHDYGVHLRAQQRAASRRERYHVVNDQPSSSSRPDSPSPPSSDQMGNMMAILERLQVGQTQMVASMDQGFGRLDRRIGRVEARQIDLAHYVTQCVSIQFRHSGLGDLPPAPDSIWQPYSSPEHQQQPPQPDVGDDEQ